MRTIASATSSKAWSALMSLTLLMSCLSRSAGASDAPSQMRRGFRVAASVQDGLYTVLFRTPQGTVTLDLPADLRTGETCLATVVTQPKGSKPEERDANQALLNTYTLTIGEEMTAVQQPGSPWKLRLGSAGTASAVILKDQQGMVAARSVLSVPAAGDASEQNDHTQPGSPQPMHFPVKGHAGRPLMLRGGLLWESAPLHVLIGGKEAVLLAASVRNVVVMTPQDVTGKTTLQIKQGDLMVYDGAYRNDRVRRRFNPWPYVIGTAVVVGTLITIAYIEIGSALSHLKFPGDSLGL